LWLLLEEPMLYLPLDAQSRCDHFLCRNYFHRSLFRNSLVPRNNARYPKRRWRTWPPSINVCPDMLSYLKVGDANYCVDTIGNCFRRHRKVCGSNASPTERPDYFFNLNTDEIWRCSCKSSLWRLPGQGRYMEGAGWGYRLGRS
jgi:hypothetical protein